MGCGGGGRPPYRVVARLLAVASDEWPAIGGSCTAAGIDPFALRLDEFCNLVYAWLLERTDDRSKLDGELTKPADGMASSGGIRATPTTDTRRETANAMAVAQWAAGVGGAGR